MLRTLATVNKTIFGNSPQKTEDTDEMATPADKITLGEFKEALSRYPALIKSKSTPCMYCLINYKTLS
jgi:hypothetical protein